MDAIKQKMIDICRINIEDDENLIKIAREKHYKELFERAMADKKENERKLAELLAE